MPNHHQSGKVTTRGRRQRPPKPVSVTNHVEFQSVLRIRPLLKKEKDDATILEPAKNNNQKDVAVAVLHPTMHFSSPDGTKRKSGNLSSPKFIQQGRQEEFHFDKVFTTSQDDVYYSTGLEMATNAMEPLKKNSSSSPRINHVALVMGVANSGKTHTTFGNLRELGRPGRSQDDGLVPRILESLFSQSKHHVSSKKKFAVQMTLLHVEKDKVHDLLLLNDNATNAATPPSSKKKSGVMAMVASLESGNSAQKASTEISIDQDPATHDYVPNALVKTCWSSSEARQVLQGGLSRGLSSKFAGLTKGHSRGHTLITLKPVIIRGSKRDSTAVDKSGGTITFLDMAGMECSTKSKSRGGGSGAVRDSIANNSCNSAIQHVLRSLKHNQNVTSGKVSSEIDCGDEDDTFDGSELSCVSEPKSTSKTSTVVKPVPYRQSKVTMLLQPLFSSNANEKRTTTVVTTMLTAYPGYRDYTEKRSLLNEMELLFGSDIAKRMKLAVNTGVNPTPKQVHGNSDTTMQDDTSEETSSLEMSDDDDEEEEQVPAVVKPRMARMKRNEVLSPPVVPSAPPLHDYDDVPVPMPPPPFAPGSQASISVEASAPPIDDMYPNKGTPMASTTLRESTPPSSQRRTQVVDLPGVTIPHKSSSTPLPPSSTKHRATPLGTKRTPPFESVSRTMTSPRYTSPPLSNTIAARPKQPSSVTKASVCSTPNIQPPPLSGNKENAASAQRDESPSRKWKDTSPMKTISRAVHSSKKHGKRAIDKVDKIMDRAVARRMSNEYEPKPDDTSNDALLHRVQVLEKKNTKLITKNEALTEKCEQLTTENEQLKRAAQSSKMQWRKDCWTMQDEQEWQRSKRIRLDEQDLIRDSLREHLENVQESYENSNQWMRPTKDPFSLQFPSHWQRAPDLDERDRTLLEGAKAPPSTPADAAAARSSSHQKRTQMSAFKKRLEMIDSNKRYKHQYN